jgi:hypothetical protein
LWPWRPGLESQQPHCTFCFPLLLHFKDGLECATKRAVCLGPKLKMIIIQRKNSFLPTSSGFDEQREADFGRRQVLFLLFIFNCIFFCNFQIKILYRTSLQKKRHDDIVILVGPPCNGNSTFCETVIGASRQPLITVCQVLFCYFKAF